MFFCSNGTVVDSDRLTDLWAKGEKARPHFPLSHGHATIRKTVMERLRRSINISKKSIAIWQYLPWCQLMQDQECTWFQNKRGDDTGGDGGENDNTFMMAHTALMNHLARDRHQQPAQPQQQQQGGDDDNLTIPIPDILKTKSRRSQILEGPANTAGGNHVSAKTKTCKIKMVAFPKSRWTGM